MRAALVPTALLLVGLLAGPSPASAATVTRVSPQGSVRDVAQVTIGFDEAMVPMGDPRLPAPADVACGGAKGSGRWVDARNWAYDFEDTLPAGLRCSVKLKAELKTEAGAAITGKREFAFDTGGPAVRRSMPYEGASGIDSDQLFLLALDAPATRESIEQHAWCAVDNLSERLPVKLLEGAERKAVLDQREQLGYQYRRLLRDDGEDAWTKLSTEQTAQREQRLVLLRCARPLPDASGVDLVWGAGIAAAGGAATRTDQVLKFETRSAFTASFSCDRLNPQAGCVPVLPMSLRFSAPVPARLAAKVRIEGGGRTFEPKAFEDGEVVVDRIEFAAPFPESASLSVALPDDLADDAGRPLSNAGSFPLAIGTDAAPPLAKFPSEFGILELKQGGVLPVTLRDIEDPVNALAIGGKSKRIDDEAQVIDWMARVHRAANGRWEDRSFVQPGVDSVFAGDSEVASFEFKRPVGGKAFEVVGIPLREPGFHVVEIASPRLGEALIGPGKTRYVATTALVTNLSVHFKWGRESSLAFVTTLDRGKPVANADVRVVDGCDASPIWQGRSDENGIVRIAAALPKPQTWSSCENGGDSAPLLVSARHDGDFSFVLSSWNEGISPYDFNLSMGLWDTPTIGHTVLDRSLFRAGETVSMKHYWRRHDAGGLRVPAEAPDKLVVEHIGGEQRVELPLSFDAHGIATSEWKIPDSARLGEYNLRLEGPEKPDGERISADSGSFRVEQYRVPLMRALVEPPKQPAIALESLPLDLYVGYFSGGGAGGLGVKLRSQLQPKALDFPGYDGYRFGAERIALGLVENGEYGDDGNDEGGKPASSRTQSLVLDANGAAHAVIDDLPKLDEPKTLVTELEYPDANGQIASVRGNVALWPAGVVVGVASGNVKAGDALKVQAVVLGVDGKPAANRPVSVTLYERKSHGYRKRLVGGFYAYSSSTETRKLGADCSGRSDAQGRFECSIDPKATGNITIEAVARDDEGRRSRATNSAWISGSDDDWFAQGDSDRMDVIPEQRQLAPGQKLKLQVRSPFRHATALVSIEREGVLDAFVTEISGSDPTIEVPMLDRYAPNVYVSVLALRPRVSDFRSRLASFLRWLRLDRFIGIEGGNPTAMVDLSKPAYRLGIAAVDVGWDAHRLLVKVKPAQPQYKTRDKASVDIEVKTADGKPLPEGAELAFTAVDEALLDLLPNRSVEVLEAMMQRRGIEVLTSTAQMQVVGKRHYGRKSAAPGGGGGRGAPREMLNSLLSWQARVPLDAQGRAKLEVPLNDALTEFRFTAVASAGSDRFGEGHASVRTTQDVQLLSGLPPLVREGDEYAAQFTLRNTSDQPQSIALSATLRDQSDAELPAPASQQISLPAQSAQPVHFTVSVPYGIGGLSWTVSAKSGSGETLDALRVTQQVAAAVPVRVQQATLLQVDGPQSLPVAAPSDALRGTTPESAARGGVRVALSPSLTASLAGVREWMQAYPYSCNEQQASRAIATNNRENWDTLMSRLPTALDGDGLAKYWAIDTLEGSDVLTSYLVQLADTSGWPIPDDTRERMLGGLERYAEGRIRRGGAIGNSVLVPRRLAAIEALSRHDRAKPQWLESMSFDPTLLPTSALIDWIGILQRVDKLPRKAERLAEAKSVLRARFDLQGTRLGLSSDQDSLSWWLMGSVDSNINRAILALLKEADWKADLPRLVRGAVDLQKRGHWDLSTANAWGSLALEQFAAAFERGKVTGSTRAELGEAIQQSDWNSVEAGADPPPLDLPWPLASGELKLAHDGGGAPWAIVQTRAAVPLREPFSAGYRIKRTITAVERKHQDRWSIGDVARIRLEVEAASDMGWVVVDDPVPAGSSIVGNLGRDSALLAAGEQAGGNAWPSFEERRFDAYRAYYEYVPKGRFSTEYTLRFNAAGRFTLPATRVEAMYAPEMFGETPNEVIEVKEP
ncbi:alpha-2-macroglobulin family protein [Hydrocarboniphaga effusa]|uniref:alpha-2-macroglobulin family protein n=1 Tax=Hydrocarboniphaga effusa TaxID=243629 RepID=UPI0035B177BB